MPVLITRENAAEYARRANAARMAKRKLERETRDTPAPPLPSVVATNPYQMSRLRRVRMQIDLLDEEIRSCIKEGVADAGRLDRMVAAQARLAEQERILSGRPLPGSLRPRGSAAPKAANSAPIAEEHGTDDAS